MPLDLNKIPSVDLNNVESFKAWNVSMENNHLVSDKKGELYPNTVVDENRENLIWLSIRPT